MADLSRSLSAFQDSSGGGWMRWRGQLVYVPGPLRVSVPLGELRNMLPVERRGRFDNLVADARYKDGSEATFLRLLSEEAQQDAAFRPLAARLAP